MTRGANALWKRALLCSGAILAVAGSPQAAAAQAGREIQLDELVVTATRTEQRLRDVPVSVAAYSQATMDERNVKQIDDVVRLTPGITFSRSGYGNGSGTAISIRGIASGAGASTTGIYINDTPIQVRDLGFTATNAYPQIFDLERVEVLRGPQGTLFGAGAQGGTLRFITPQPGLSDYSGYSRAEIATTKGGALSYEGGSAIGGPILQDRIGFRASAFFRRDAGWIDWAPPIANGRVEDKNANETKALALRGAMTFALTDNLRITPSIFFQREKREDTQFYAEDIYESRGAFINDKVNQQPSLDKFSLAALDASWDLGSASLVSSTSLFDRKMTALFDYTAFINATFGSSSRPPAQIPDYDAISDMQNSQQNFSQEVRLQSNGERRLKWVLGAFYSHADQHSYQAAIDPFFSRRIALTFGGATVPQIFGVPALAGDVVYLNINDGVDKQLAGFGQVDFNLTDQLIVTGGLRVSKTRFDFETYQNGPGAGGELAFEGSQKETPITPKVGLSYKPTDDLMIYASASKGFRIGGVNSPVNPVSCAGDLASLGFTSAPREYKSDSVWNYETGAKGVAFDGAVTFEASAFYVKWTGIQTSVYLPTCGVGFTTNLAKASSRGVDLAFSARLSEQLRITGSVGLIDARYDETVTAGSGAAAVGIVQEGDKLPGSPFTLSVSGRYEFDEVMGRSPYLQVSYDHTARLDGATPTRNPLNFNFDAGAQPAQTVKNVGVRAGVEWSGVDVALFANNLLDTTPRLSRYHESTRDPVFYNLTLRPRTVGITASMRY